MLMNKLDIFLRFVYFLKLRHVYFIPFFPLTKGEKSGPIIFFNGSFSALLLIRGNGIFYGSRLYLKAMRKGF